MAATVYSGLQSCLESQLIESRILRLQLSPLPSSSSTPFHSQSIELALKSCFCNPTENGDDIITTTTNDSDSFHGCNLGGFSSLQALSNKTQSLLDIEQPLDKQSTNTTMTASIYVPPMAKRSSLVLSERSLQLCTENLGNETGTDMTQNCIHSLETECCGKLATREQAKAAPPRSRTKKAIDMQKFPPPLTTIRGSGSLRVRSHREEGRLVIKAVKVPSSESCFQAERSHGRLRLCFLKNRNPIFDSEADIEGEQGNEGIDEEYEAQVENDVNGQRREMEEEDLCGEQKYCPHGEEREEDIDGNELGVGDDIGMEKHEWPSRWNECEPKSPWEAFFVATS